MFDGADLVNAGIYYVRGKKLDATISALGSLPFVGETAKAGKYAIKLSKGARLAKGTKYVAKVSKTEKDVVHIYKIGKDGKKLLKYKGTIQAIGKGGNRLKNSEKVLKKATEKGYHVVRNAPKVKKATKGTKKATSLEKGLKGVRGSKVKNSKKVAKKHKSGSGSVIKNIQSKSPQQLIEDGWEDITNPKMAANTNSREFYDPKSGLKIRFDKGVDGANGFEAVDHYHVMNPNYTNKKVDYYLDIDGKPVGKGSKASHIVIKGEE